MGAAEVRDDPQGGLRHAELHVVGKNPQVTGQRQLEPSSNRVALHRCNGDPRRATQPREAGLETGDDGIGVSVGQVRDPGDAGHPVDFTCPEEAPVETG